jgi:hypothetical protein
LRGNNFDLLEDGIELARRFKRRLPLGEQQIAAKLAADNRCAGEEAVAARVVRVIMGVDHVTDRDAKLIFNK